MGVTDGGCSTAIMKIGWEAIPLHSCTSKSTESFPKNVDKIFAIAKLSIEENNNDTEETWSETAKTL